MKKFIVLALCITLLVFVCTIPSMALVNLNANQAEISVDGVRDAAYGDNYTVIAGPKDGTDPKAATGKVWTAWDSKYLYFYVEVNDTTPNHETDADNVEFMLDWNSGKGDANFATPETPYWQVRAFASPPNQDGANLNGLILAGDNEFDWGPSEFFESTCKWACIPIDGNYKNGYIVELAIAAPAGVTLSQGKTIPIEIQICDNITGDAREGQMFLEANENNDNQWNTPSACNGLLTLGAAYTAPAAVNEPAPEPAANNTPADNNTPASSTVNTAPVTGDNVIILIAVMVIAVAGAIVLLKKRNSIK